MSNLNSYMVRIRDEIGDEHNVRVTAPDSSTAKDLARAKLVNILGGPEEDYFIMSVKRSEP